MDDRQKLMRGLFAALRDLGIGEEDRHVWATCALGRNGEINPVTSFRELTEDDIKRLIDAAQWSTDDDGPCGEPGCIGHDLDGWCVGEDGETWPARVGAR